MKSLDETKKVGVDVEVTGTEKAKKDGQELVETVEKTTKAFDRNTNALNRNASAEDKQSQSTDKSVLANKKLANTIGDMSKKLTLQSLRYYAGMIAQVARKTIELSKYSVDYIENLNLMDSAFGKNAQSAREWIKNISDIYGFDESLMAKELGMFRQFGNALGFASDKADLLSKNLTLMAGDISSLYNITFEQASNKLTSALTGQTKAIRSLGADITQATLQQELYNMGINESISDMNRAEKTLLIYLTLERQLAASQGDLAKTLMSPSNQMKIFTEQVHRLARAIGNSLLPMLASILPIVNGVIMALTELFNFLAILLGYDEAKFSFGGALVDLDEMSAGVGNVGDALDGVSGSAGKAGKSVDDLKKKLSGLRAFDKLNVIQTPNDTSSGSSGGSGGGGGVGGLAGGGINSKLLDALKQYNAHLEQAGDKAKRIRNRILEWLGFSRDANGEWKLTNVTWGNMLVAALGILTAFRIIRGIGKLLGLGSIGKGMVKVFSKIATLVGGKGAAAGGATAGGGIAGGLGEAAAAAGALIAGIVLGATSANTLFKILDNARASTQTHLSLWEQIVTTLTYGVAPILSLIPLTAFAISKSMKKIDIFSDISKGTKEKLKPLYDELEVFDKKIANLDFSNKIIDDKDISVIKERTKTITGIIVNELDADKNDQLKRIKGMQKILGANDYKGIEEATKKYYDNQKKTVEKNENEINDIVKKAKGRKEGLTKEEIERINKLRDESEKIGLQASTKNQEELEKIYLRAKYNRENIAVREASNIIKASKEKYEAVVKDAEETRRATIDEANKMREAGIITKDQYDKIVKAADDAKNDTVKKAKEQYDGVKSETKKGLGENAKYIDEKTGEVKSNWSVWWDDLKKKASGTWKDINDDTSKNSGDLQTSIAGAWDGIKKKSSEKWATIKKWVEDNILNKYFSAKWWKGEWEYIVSSAETGLKRVHSKIKSVWDGIKKWLDDKVFKYFTKSYWNNKWATIKTSVTLPHLHIRWEPLNVSDKMKKALDALGIGTKIPKLSVSWYASGGFPEKGELFVAREQGAEMVGSIGNKTAVANNDQIVQAISIGVQRAMEKSGMKNTKVVIEAKGDSSGLMNFITYKQKEESRQFGL